jgi:hypothetical protein
MDKPPSVSRNVPAGTLAVTLLFGFSGCVLPGTDGDPNGSDGTAPFVTLTVSNPTPQINEEVSLVCTVVAGTGTGTSFDFQPDDGRLIVNPATGLALLVVSELDVGSALTYTCTATNTNGTSQPSTAVTIFPTS